MDIWSTSRSFTNSVRSIKRIYVWENGDCNGNGHVLVINPKLYRSWNGILSLITNTIRPSFGFVRTLIHLDSKDIVRSFEALVPNGKYVALGTEKLKLFKDGYKTLKEKQGSILPTPVRPQRPGTVRVVIFVLANGKTRETPCKVVITDFDMQAWRLILQAIARKLDIPTGIRYLTNVDGDAVLDPASLQNGLIYVAVPFDEDFSRLDYNKIFKSLLPMREVDLKDLDAFTEVHGVINDPIVLQAGCHNTVSKSKSEGFNLNPKKTIANGHFSSQKRDCHTLTEHPKCTTRAISVQSLLEEAFVVDLTDEPEKDTFPSGTKSKSCGCSKANKATVTAGAKQEKSFSYHCHPNNCQLQCVVCVKDAGNTTEKTDDKKPLTLRSPAHQHATSSKSCCSSSHQEFNKNTSFSGSHSKSLPENLAIPQKAVSKTSSKNCCSSSHKENNIEKTTVKTHEETSYNNENTSFNGSQNSKQAILTEAISSNSYNNVKSRRFSLNGSDKADTIYSTSFSKGSPEKDTSEGSKSLPGLTPPETSKLCYCKSCQTKPHQPCAPGQCTTMIDKGQLAKVTTSKVSPGAKSSPKVHVSAQTPKRSKNSCCKWLKSTFRTSPSSGTKAPDCTSKATGSDSLQNNDCMCAPKGCCIPELCRKTSGQLNVKPQPVVVEEIGCMAGNEEPFEDKSQIAQKNRTNPDKSDNYCYPNTCQLLGYKSVSTEASCPTATKGYGAPHTPNSSGVTTNSPMSNENPSNGKPLPHTAKFCKLEPPEEIECVVRPGQIVFRRLSPQVELLYQKPLEQPDDEDDGSVVTPLSSSEPTIKDSEIYEKLSSSSGGELNQIHMSLKEFIEDVIDTSVYLIDQFEMVPKEQFSIPIRQGTVTIPAAAREVIDDIITKSSLTIQIDELPKKPEKVTSQPTPVEQILSLPPKCPELDHSGCCPCPAAITTSKDVVEFASQYDPHYTKSLTQGTNISNDSFEEEFSTEKSATPRTSILRSSIVSSPYSISGNKPRVSIKIPGEKKLLYTYTDSRSDMGLRNVATSSDVFLPENMIFEQYMSEPNSTAQSTMTVVPTPKTVETQTPKCYCREPSCTCKFVCLGRTLAVSEPSKGLQLSEMSVVSEESLNGMLVGDNTYNGPASIEMGIGGPSSSIIDSHLRLFDLPSSRVFSNQYGSLFCIRSDDEINKPV